MGSDEMKELLAETTPGPWVAKEIKGHTFSQVEGEIPICDVEGLMLADVGNYCETEKSRKVRPGEESANARLIAMAPDLAAEVLRLRAEVEHFTKSGIVEIAARNPSVMEYMKHWEGRAEKAEAEVERLTEAITLIERCYYMEGKDAKWRAAHMNGIARDAQNGDGFAWARRMFPRDNQHL